MNFGTTILSPYQHFAYFFTYYIGNIISLSSAILFINCVQLCRERLGIVKKLLCHQDLCSTESLETILKLYIRIRNQILLINSFIVVLLKVAHDFTLGSSIMYLLCTSGILNFAWSFSQTVIGTLLMAIIAEMLTTEVFWILCLFAIKSLIHVSFVA